MRGAFGRHAGQPLVRALVPEESLGRISRRALLAGAIGLGAVGALAACSKSSGFAASAAPDGQLEGQLNVYSWGDYDDPSNLVDFSRNGVAVQFDSFGSNEELIAKLGASRGTSGYDIVVPTGLYIPMMAANGLLQELDHSRLTNLKHLDPIYMDQSWDPGNKYTVCKNWGTTGFAYDTRVITRPLTSWADFLDAIQKEASGNTALLEDSWEVTTAYFAANGIDPNTTDPAALDACEEFMVGTIAPHIKAFNSAAAASAIPQETFALIQAFNGDARQGMLVTDTPEAWQFVYPTPTANIWMDNWAIAAGSQNIDAAYAFIDFMLQPDVALREVDYIGYNTGVKGIPEMAAEAEFDLPELVFPPAEVVERLIPGQINDATERQIKILNRMMAKAGS